MVLLPNMYLSPILPVVSFTVEASAKYRRLLETPPVIHNVKLGDTATAEEELL